MRVMRAEAGSAILALSAQALNFLMILLPVALGRLDETAILVFGGAIAVIAATTCSWSFTSVYPGLTDARDRSVSLLTSSAGVLTASALVVLVGVGLTIASISLGGVVLAAGALALAQGFYFIAVTLLVQEGDFRRFARTRLGYAIANVVFTTIATLWVPWLYALIAATGLAFATGVLVALHGRWGVHARELRSHAIKFLELPRYVARNWAATIASLFSAVSGQSAALATPMLGPVGPLWASVVRIAGGFAGTLVQVLAPFFEMRLSRAIRESPGSSTRGLTWAATGAGFILAVVAYGGILLVLSIGEWLGPIPDLRDASVLVIVSVYVVGLLLPVASQRFLVMIGHQRAQLAFIVTKLSASVLALVFLENVPLLLALALIELLAAIAYLTLMLTVGSRVGPDRGSDSVFVDHDFPQENGPDLRIP